MMSYIKYRPTKFALMKWFCQLQNRCKKTPEIILWVKGGGDELAKFRTKAQNWIFTGRLGTHMADQEIGAISGSLLDNLGELVYM